MKNTVILLALVLVAPMAFAQEQKQAAAPAAQAVQDASKGSTIQYNGKTYYKQVAETVGDKYEGVTPKTVQTTNRFHEQLTREEMQELDLARRHPRAAEARDATDITITDITVQNGVNPHTIAKNEVNNFVHKEGYATVRNTKDPNNLSAGHMDNAILGSYEIRTCTVEGCHVRVTSEKGQLAPGKWEKLNGKQLEDVLQNKINESKALQSVKLDPGVDRR